eukprot:CAMPEP_0194413768 /NCGR_PEP_ID=MMETSP0176-20130528/12348_1 /TAXON_ID=216777 /ORGANISM="Proboscia alata, Strain PI-D3" /LENGTH=1525 /DNA_ID=CAMNT_0039217333 /DNA_START=40 /DNA_END=4617 /DNA_ORIENTATION=-
MVVRSVLVTFILQITTILNYSVNAHTERQLLHDLYTTLNGGQWTTHTHWLDPKIGICDYYGIVCANPTNNNNTDVIAINLSKNNLKGSLPMQLFAELDGNIHLKRLDLSNNLDLIVNFTGFEYLTTLELLDVSTVASLELDGIGGIAESKTLHSLNLERNELKGTLHPELYALTSLRKLYLAQNDFTGPLRNDMGEAWSHLEQLYLSHNQLTGTLPLSLGKILRLNIADFSNNNWSGGIPTTFNELVELTSLDLHNGGLSGPLRSFHGCESLTRLSVADNLLTGTIPETFLSSVDVSSALNLDLSDNQLTGSIPNGLTRFESMTIDATGNQFTSIDMSLCAMSSWNNGYVSQYECQGILCPPGTYNDHGRLTQDNDECLPCNGNAFWGMTQCLTPSPLYTDHEILQMVYVATGGDDWMYNTLWNVDSTSACFFMGVKCDEENNIIGLELQNNGLTGTPPKELFLLPHLQTLNLKGNQIVFSFEGIEDAKELAELQLTETNTRDFTGLENAQALEIFHAVNNKLTGTLPSELWQLTTLQEIWLSGNTFTGTMPALMGGLTNLEELHLAGNDLTGPIPAALGKLTKLRVLVLDDNKLDTLNSIFNDLVDLEVLNVSKQREGGLIGKLPAFHNNPLLTELHFDHNMLTGTIATTFLEGYVNAAYKSAVVVDLSGNRLTGTVPGSLNHIEDLTVYLEDNQLSGLDGGLCQMSQWMGDRVGTFGCDAILCPPLTYQITGRQEDAAQACINCESNTDYYGQTTCEFEGLTTADILQLLYTSTGGPNWMVNDGWSEYASGVTSDGVTNTGDVCTWYGVQCETVGYNDVSGSVVKIVLKKNNLIGSIPSELYQLSSLRHVDLASNGINFKLDDIAQWKDLTFLSLSHTMVRDYSTIGNAKALTVLELEGNNIAGRIPDGIFDLVNLVKLDLSENKLTGYFPNQITALSKMQLLYLDGNAISGSIPNSIKKLSNLVTLNLSGNALTGHLPFELEKLTKIRTLSLAKQEAPGLVGSLLSFSGNTDLIYLELNGNSLTGSIPDSFLELSTIGASDGAITVMLHDNLLTGTIPENLATFQNMDIELRDNLITGRIPQDICMKLEWNHGNVGDYACKGILCSPGTFNPDLGRQSSPVSKCQNCPNDKVSFYYGATSCVEGSNPTKQPIQAPREPPTRAPTKKENANTGNKNPRENLEERAILIELYDMCNGLKWYRQGNWNVEGAHICTWDGIYCGAENVESIDLAANNLIGTPPSSLFKLSKLSFLGLQSNPIDFSFYDIESAENLAVLYLYSTKISSLDGIGKGLSLVEVNLRFNNLSGFIPNELSNLINLESLTLSDNKYFGYLGETYDTMLKLRELRLGSNALTGDLPKFNKQTNLQHLDLSGNSLSSTIPAAFLSNNKAPKLTLDLSSNILVGRVPAEVFGRFNQLVIYLRNNMFTGIDQSLCNQSPWNNGDVGNYGCSGLLCPQSTWNEKGRETANSPCVPCDEARYLGSVTCGDSDRVQFNTQSFSGSSALILAKAVIIISPVIGMLFAYV